MCTFIHLTQYISITAALPPALSHLDSNNSYGSDCSFWIFQENSKRLPVTGCWTFSERSQKVQASRNRSITLSSAHCSSPRTAPTTLVRFLMIQLQRPDESTGPRSTIASSVWKKTKEIVVDFRRRHLPLTEGERHHVLGSLRLRKSKPTFTRATPSWVLLLPCVDGGCTASCPPSLTFSTPTSPVEPSDSSHSRLSVLPSGRRNQSLHACSRRLQLHPPGGRMPDSARYLSTTPPLPMDYTPTFIKGLFAQNDAINPFRCCFSCTSCPDAAKTNIAPLHSLFFQQPHCPCSITVFFIFYCSINLVLCWFIIFLVPQYVLDWLIFRKQKH